jgi:protein-disulfide isomerase
MSQIFRAVLLASALIVLACGQPTAQSSQDIESLRKEIEALKASLAGMQRDVQEIRTFLKEATGGRFGLPPLENSEIDVGAAPVNGPDSARVTLVEVSDYHCPFCRRHFQQTQPQIYANYVNTGKVRHVFVHYPIDQLHPDAFLSHEAASCAADQGKFWELHGKLFESPAKTTEQIVALAQAAGVEVGSLRRCLDSDKYASAVRESVQQMQQLGIDSTPTFLIGLTPAKGQRMKVLKVVKGAHQFASFQTAIDAILGQSR